ncbi:MAG: response regulator [Bacteroidales bacterium]|nr:response regulator [Bacteroidales bacterium]
METNPERILIVDDIFSNRLLLSSALEGLGLASKSVGNGQAAIDLLQEEAFSMVLLDIEMPVMNGLETVRYIRKQMKDPVRNMPVVALTAHNPNEYGDEIQSAGFSEILTKPYSIDKLQNLLDKYLTKDNSKN